MIVNVLVLEDVQDWGQDLCNRLNALDSSFFDNIETDISKIVSVLATNGDGALQIIQTSKIDLITIDIKLDEEEEGHEFYEKLFVKGYDIPSIVVSGEVDTPGVRNEIIGKGIPTIVRKLHGQDPIHIRVANAICEVLDSPRKLLFQLETKVEHFDVWDHKIADNGETKTISKWLSEMAESGMRYNEMKPLRKKIMDICNEQAKYEQR